MKQLRVEASEVDESLVRLMLCQVDEIYKVDVYTVVEAVKD